MHAEDTITLDEYQRGALRTAMYPRAHTVIYPALGLAGEAGEVCEKIKKALRDHHGVFDRDALTRELGDVLWYVAVLANDLGLTLGDIATTNLAKLADRAERGVLGGEGDTR